MSEKFEREIADLRERINKLETKLLIAESDVASSKDLSLLDNFFQNFLEDVPEELANSNEISIRFFMEIGGIEVYNHLVPKACEYDKHDQIIYVELEKRNG